MRNNVHQNNQIYPNLPAQEEDQMYPEFPAQEENQMYPELPAQESASRMLAIHSANPEFCEQDARDTLTYLDPYSEIEIIERHLPHWYQQNVTYFVTFHLADSIPLAKREEIEYERKIWKKNHTEPYNNSELKEYYCLFSERIDELLNAGMGSCCLSDPINAKIVGDAIKFFNNDRYILDEWVVMPNHAHVILKPLKDNKLPDILFSWKSYTSNQINKRMNMTGQLWMHDTYDHIIRNDKSLEKIREYIRNNPSKAGITVSQSSNMS